MQLCQRQVKLRAHKVERWAVDNLFPFLSIKVFELRADELHTKRYTIALLLVGTQHKRWQITNLKVKREDRFILEKSNVV